MTKRAVAIPDRGEISDDTPLRLDIAARLMFPDGSIGLSSLRREVAKGRLQVWRIAGKDMTTLSEIRNMVTRCLVSPSPPAYGSGQVPPTENPSGSSSTEDDTQALAAALMKARRLKKSSQTTSPESASQPPSGNVIHLR